jgi:hypothetical protein
MIQSNPSKSSKVAAKRVIEQDAPGDDSWFSNAIED